MVHVKTNFPCFNRILPMRNTTDHQQTTNTGGGGKSLNSESLQFADKIYKALGLPWDLDSATGRRERFSFASVCRRIDESELLKAAMPKFKSLAIGYAREIGDPHSKKCRYQPSAQRRAAGWTCVVLGQLRFFTWNKYCRKYVLGV